MEKGSEKGHLAKEGKEHLEAGKGRERTSVLAPLGGRGTLLTLLL
jgi:hypothetical protein